MSLLKKWTSSYLYDFQELTAPLIIKLVYRSDFTSYGFNLKNFLVPKNFMNCDLLFTKPNSSLAEF